METRIPPLKVMISVARGVLQQVYDAGVPLLDGFDLCEEYLTTIYGPIDVDSLRNIEYKLWSMSYIAVDGHMAEEVSGLVMLLVSSIVLVIIADTENLRKHAFEDFVRRIKKIMNLLHGIDRDDCEGEFIAYNLMASAHENATPQP